MSWGEMPFSPQAPHLYCRGLIATLHPAKLDFVCSRFFAAFLGQLQTKNCANLLPASPEKSRSGGFLTSARNFVDKLWPDITMAPLGGGTDGKAAASLN